MLKIIAMAAALTILVPTDGSVLQTGQVKSYNADGDVVTDGSVKDDGYYRAGKVRSYGRSGDVVTDNATGLQWQDDESIQKTWSKAIDYCSSLPLNGGFWLLPSVEQLQTLVDYSQYDPSATESVFSHISSYYYWSSTARANYMDYKWVVYFDNSSSYSNYKVVGNYVRCVRGGQSEPSNLSRDKVTEIVTDNKTKLQWQDNAIVSSTQRSWTEAIDYCENTLDLGGHADWRLPNVNELLSIADYSRSNPAINNSVFANTSPNYYWSSTANVNSAGNAWLVSFYYGYSSYYHKTLDGYVRCVRGGQLGHSVNPSIIMYLLN